MFIPQLKWRSLPKQLPSTTQQRDLNLYRAGGTVRPPSPTFLLEVQTLFLRHCHLDRPRRPTQLYSARDRHFLGGDELVYYSTGMGGGRGRPPSTLWLLVDSRGTSAPTAWSGQESRHESPAMPLRKAVLSASPREGQEAGVSQAGPWEARGGSVGTVRYTAMLGSRSGRG